jgi:hypothetical protein
LLLSSSPEGFNIWKFKLPAIHFVRLHKDAVIVDDSWLAAAADGTPMGNVVPVLLLLTRLTTSCSFHHNTVNSLCMCA